MRFRTKLPIYHPSKKFAEIFTGVENRKFPDFSRFWMVTGRSEGVILDEIRKIFEFSIFRSRKNPHKFLEGLQIGNFVRERIRRTI